MIYEEVFEVVIQISRFFVFTPASSSYTDGGVQGYTLFNRLEFTH